MNNIRAYEQRLQRINERLTEIDKRLEDYRRKTPESFATEKISAVRGEISSYLQKMSSVLLKVCKLSGGLLYVSDGRVMYDGSLSLPRVDYGNITEEVEKYENSVTSSLKKMAASGVKKDGLYDLGSGLMTLYKIYSEIDSSRAEFMRDYKSERETVGAGLTAEKKALNAEKVKIEKQISQLRAGSSKLRDSFGFENMRQPSERPSEIVLPYALGEADVKTWNVSDGILAVFSSDPDASVNFIKSLAVKFLYSYTGSDKQILYLSKKTNDEMNNFLRRLAGALPKDLFFSGIRHTDSFDFERDLINAFSLLKRELEDRSALLDKENLSDILDYNKRSSVDVKPPVLVILNNYPFGFEHAVDLDYFFENGRKAGIYFVVVQTGEDLKLNAWSSESIADPQLYCDEMPVISGEEIIFGSDVYERLKINSRTCDALVSELSGSIKTEKKVLSYYDVGFGSETAGGEQVREVISVPIGKIENKVYDIEFAVSGKDETKPIAYLLIGAPMTGKSSLIDSMIFNGCMKYSPDDLEFYLIDFKDGVSSATYASAARMPHIKVLAESSKQEEAEIILKTLINEQTRRNNILKKHNCKNLADYNAIAEKHIPRIIVVIDEVQKLFREEDSDYARAERLAKDLEQIVREARSVGIHVVLASQDASRKMMSCVGKFVPGRFCFGAALEDAENILSRENAKRVLTECDKPGVALVSHNGGADCSRIKIAYHESQEGQYAAKVREKWHNYPVDIAIVGQDGPLYAPDAAKEKELYSSDPYEIPFGESFYDHTVSTFSFNNYNHSLLLLGEDERIQTDIFKSVIIGALRMNAKVMLLDESRDFELQDIFSGHPNVSVFEAGTYLQMLKEVYAEYKKRSENRRAKHEPYFVILNNLAMVDAFTDNAQLKQKAVSNKSEEDLPDWYDSSWKSGFDSDLNDGDEKPVYGAETFYEILGGLGRVNNFYLCFSLDKAQSVKRGISVLSECDYKVIHSPFVESMSNIVGNIYKNNLVSSCNENIVLLSEKGQSFMKVRYYKYDNDNATFEYIRRTGSKK